MTPDQEKAKAILGVVNHYLLHGDYPHLGKSELAVVAQALLAFSTPRPEAGACIRDCDACGERYYSSDMCDGCGVTLVRQSKPQRSDA